MGRHDDPNPAPFYTSLGRAILRGLLALFLSFGLYAVLANIRDGREMPPTAALQPRGIPPERTSQTPAGTPSPAEQATSSFTPSATPSATPSDGLAATAPRSADTTVQVLDGGAGQRRTDEVVTALRTLGYQIVAVNKAVRTYKVTTVYYSRGEEASARALRARDWRFAEIDLNPNLNQRVALHVVVGTDWR